MKSAMVFLLGLFTFVELEPSKNTKGNSYQQRSLSLADMENTLANTLFYTVKAHRAKKNESQFAVLYLQENASSNLNYDNDEVRVGLTTGTFNLSDDMPVWPTSNLTNLAVARVKYNLSSTLKGHSEYLLLQKLEPMMMFYQTGSFI